MMVDNGAGAHAVFESGAILQYLGYKFPMPLYRTDPILVASFT